MALSHYVSGSRSTSRRRVSMLSPRSWEREAPTIWSVSSRARDVYCGIPVSSSFWVDRSRKSMWMHCLRCTRRMPTLFNAASKVKRASWPAWIGCGHFTRFMFIDELNYTLSHRRARSSSTRMARLVYRQANHLNFLPNMRMLFCGRTTS
jgi:hypothetical protein